MSLERIPQREMLELARHAMLSHLGRKPMNHRLNSTMEDMSLAGIFVSLRDRADNSVIGSVGRLGPTNDTLGQIIAETAVATVANDYRLETVTKDGLKNFQIEIAILYDLKNVDCLQALAPSTLGLVVETSSKKGVLLPSDSGDVTAELQLSKAKKQAGIETGEQIKMATFQVFRFQD